MDHEKFVNSRFFAACEWLWRLVILNFLTLITCCGVITILAATSACVKSFKAYQEGYDKNVFVTYWVNLKSCIVKSLIHSAIFVILGLIIGYAIWTYLLNLEAEDLTVEYKRFYTIGLSITFIFGLIVLISFLQYPLLFTYFKFGFFEQFKMGIYMGMKYVLITLVGLASVAGSVAMFLYATPLWFFIGVSLPLFLIYAVSRNKYGYLSFNIYDIKDEEKLDYKRDEEEWFVNYYIYEVVVWKK